ncbi:hypothetical protein ACQEV4_42720 [Streptomyces shenzhenensis]|uniref:hypothetical protein n=1 Tax=Streptomyces shenzhenensis TaxID=943815 RepID=UPI003D943B96
MASLNAVSVPIAGGLADIAGATAAAAAGGDTAPVGPNLALFVANGAAAPVTVTVTTPGTVKGLAISDVTLTVAAGKSGLLPLANIFRGANGRAAITYSSAASVTVAVLRLEDWT